MKAFQPPNEPSRRQERASGTLLIATWMICGAALGLAVGISAQTVGRPGLSVPASLAGALLAAAAGAVAWFLERRHAEEHRPALLDARGRLRRPVHVALWLVPLLIALPGLLWMAVLGSVVMQSLVPAGVFGMTAIALLWGLRKLVSGHRLTRALEALELGQLDQARLQLTQIQSSVLTTSAVRAVCRLNLGVLAMQHGSLAEAAAWYGQIRGGAAAMAFARVGLALLKVLEGAFDEAEDLLLAIASAGASRVVQSQADEVRLLLVLRREGLDPARDLGERLLGPGAGSLYLGVLAFIRHEQGDLQGARDLLDGGARASLQASGLATSIEELRTVLAA